MRQERELIERAREFETAELFCQWMIERGIPDLKRCRIWAMRRHYSKLMEQGVLSMDAITATSAEFFVSEATVQKAIYHHNDI